MSGLGGLFIFHVLIFFEAIKFFVLLHFHADSPLLVRSRHEGVAEGRDDSRHGHGGFQKGPYHAAHRLHELAVVGTHEELLVLFYPPRQAEGHEEGEPHDEDVPLASHVGTHEHLDSQGADGSEEGDVGSPDDGRGHGGDKGAELADEAHEDEDDGSRADDPAGGHPREADEADVLRVGGGTHRSEDAGQGAVEPLGADAPADGPLIRVVEAGSVGD